MLNENKAHLLRVRAPDGSIGNMTTTIAMFREIWEPKGYSLKCDLAQFEEPDPEEVEAVESTDSEPKEQAEERPRNRTRGKRVDLPADTE